MNTARAELLRRIFDEAAERPEGERARFVREECRGDGVLEQEVLSLLEALEHRSAALEADPVMWLTGLPRRGEEIAGHAGRDEDEPRRGGTASEALDGTVIGDFRLGPLIGRGAMGAVYQAEQISLKRPVAVKLLQSWTASRELRRRFIDESMILARLKHPGIAHIIAAGIRELDLSGPDRSLAAGLFNDLHSVPWIAMELVEGAKTIVEYCRDSALPALVVLQLFAGVCDAVHHGHQQGIIHRDLKPANILVNSTGEAKVIDFGIAKAIGTGASRGDGQTVAGGLLGTLRYMSPEQCDGCGTSVDTRSDVYALGVVLYEALTGSLPYALDEGSFAAAARAIGETMPKDPRAISPAIPADAAIVLLKVLSKEPEQRYQSAAEFAADLRRVIAREPVLARRASAAYRVAMFTRRRPAMTVLIAAAVLGLIAGVVGIGIGLARERAARGEAERIAWLANLTAADSTLRLGDGGSAMRRLEVVPEKQRGWEWRYLHARADTSIKQWQITDREGVTFLSPSGRLAICHYIDHGDTHADILNLATHQVKMRIEDANPTEAAAWNSDESLLAILQRRSVVLIDARTGTEVRRWMLNPDCYPLGAAFSPDGSLLAVGLSDYAGIEVYDVGTGERVFSRPSDAWVYSTAFSPDGRTLAWSDAKGVTCADTSLWQVRDLVATARPTPVEPGGLCYSPDGGLLAVACGLVVQVIDVQTWRVRNTLRGHAQRIHSVAFDESGERIVTTSIDRTVRVWSASSGELVTTLLGHESPTSQARFIRAAGADDDHLVSIDRSNRVRVWNLKSNGPVLWARANEKTAFIAQLDFAADGSTLRAAGQDSIITIDLPGGPTVRSIQSVSGDFLSVIPGKVQVLRGVDGRTISLDSLANQTRLWSLDDEPAREFVISPDGTRAGVFREAFCVSIVRLSDGTELGRTAPADPSGYHRPAFSPDGRMLATLSRHGVLRLWNADDGAIIGELAGGGDRSNGLCWSDDSSLLAYSHAREGVTVLDMRTRMPITMIDGIGGFVWCIAISPDRRRMAVGAQDRITHIYELPSGDELLQLRDHTGTVMSIAWSRDGRYLATGGYDKRVFVYDSMKGVGQRGGR